VSAVLAALATGLLGSLHCAAMCGPLAVAGCRARGDAWRYLLGRAVSYATVGAALGLFGRRAVDVLPGRLAVLIVAAALAWRGISLLRSPRQLVQIRLVRDLGSLLPSSGLGLGLATGFLPCGLLIPAWLLAAATESATLGAVVMLAFAFASTGGLVAPLLGRPLWNRFARALPRRAQAAAWLLLAALVAMRPLLVASHCH
jgi:sulfite exporter TauE/SafE